MVSSEGIAPPSPLLQSGANLSQLRRLGEQSRTRTWGVYRVGKGSTGPRSRRCSKLLPKEKGEALLSLPLRFPFRTRSLGWEALLAGPESHIAILEPTDAQGRHKL